MGNNTLRGLVQRGGEKEAPNAENEAKEKEGGHEMNLGQPQFMAFLRERSGKIETVFHILAAEVFFPYEEDESRSKEVPTDLLKCWKEEKVLGNLPPPEALTCQAMSFFLFLSFPFQSAHPPSLLPSYPLP